MKLTTSTYVKIILVALLCLVLCGGMASCSMGCSNAARYAADSIYRGQNEAARYANLGDFSLEKNTEIHDIRIDWMAGGVTLEVVGDDANEGKVIGIEEFRGSVRDDLRMKWECENGRLSIGYGMAGIGLWGCAAAPSKHLTLQIPESVANQLDRMDLSAASGEYILDALKCENLNIDLASGRVRGERLAANTLNMDIASGNVDLSGTFDEHIGLSVASGSIDLACQEVCPGEVTMDIASGAVTVGIPSNSEFRAKVEKLSGSFTCDFPSEQTHHEERGVYTYSNGSNRFDIEMASGNVVIRQLV